jgi:hypothetical protein
MAQIAKEIPGGFSGKAGTARTGPHPEHAQGLRGAAAPAGNVQTGTGFRQPLKSITAAR